MEYLQETALGDVLKVIDAFAQVLKTPGENKDDKLWNIIRGTTTKSQYKGSITSQANKLCMTFPVLCSNSITPSTASMITKAIERKCLLIIQQLFAADMLVANANSGGILNKINGIYTGIDFDSLSVDDVIEITKSIDPGNKLFRESVMHTEQYSDEMKALAKKIMNSPIYESSVNDSPISSYMIESKYGSVKEDPEMILDEADKNIKDMWNDYVNSPKHKMDEENAARIDALIDYLDQNVERAADGTPMYTPDDIIKVSKEIRDRLGSDREAIKFKAQIDNMIKDAEYAAKAEKRSSAEAKRAAEKFKWDRDKNDRDKEKFLNDKLKNRREYQAQVRQDLLANADMFKKQLLDTDVKKVNELVPSMLVANYAINTAKDNTITSSAIVGIKARLIALDSFQILDKLALKNKDKSGLVKFIRSTTGEIKFMKDFVLAIDKAKIDAINKSKRGSANPMWRVLERRAAVNNLRKALGQKNDASPITTLVVTQEEVDYLKKMSDMELDNVNTANYIMNAFNLMGICIVDETMETAKFLFDGEFNQFDTYAFTSLQKENGDSGMYKKVINLMAKKM